VKRQKIVRPGELERAIEAAQMHRPGATGGLVLLDADDDLPCSLGPQLLQRCTAVAGMPFAVVLANREIEAWFLAGLPSIRGHRGLTPGAVFSGNPESPRDAKGQLSRLMVGRPYMEVLDQPALMACLDLQQARDSSPSLDKLLRDLDRIWP
jgi:hypothetical protein